MNTEEKIYEAVEEAIAEGMSVERFVRIAAEAWNSVHREKGRMASDEFNRLLQPKITGGV